MNRQTYKSDNFVEIFRAEKAQNGDSIPQKNLHAKKSPPQSFY